MSTRYVVILALGLAACAETAAAGTGRLVSQWMSRAPSIDGGMTAEEWSEARLVDLGGGVSVRIGNDARTLYLAVLDSGDLVHGVGDSLFLFFDDEGGTPPRLDDGSWGSAGCQQVPEQGEGELQFHDDQRATYREYSGGYCPAQLLGDRTRSHSTDGPAGVTYEVALPLDGPVALQASPGQRFALFLVVYRDSTQAGCLPTCSIAGVPEFRNLILASGGCNTGPQGFATGLTQPDLPLDWSSELGVGTGEVWVQTAVDGDEFYCGRNVTGGADAAACVTNVHYTSPSAESYLRMPLALSGQTAAAVRLRANFQPGTAGDYLAFGSRYEFIPFFSMLLWQSSQGAPGGPGIAVQLDLSLFTNNLPRELVFWHHTDSAGSQEGGFAQIDDVELVCGPILFADGFESGLATHWTATVP